MRLLRVLAVIAALIAIILFAVGALQSSSSTSFHDLYWGLVALAAALGLIALDPMVP